jgi:hypothetical protein
MSGDSKSCRWRSGRATVSTERSGKTPTMNVWVGVIVALLVSLAIGFFNG